MAHFGYKYDYTVHDVEGQPAVTLRTYEGEQQTTPILDTTWLLAGDPLGHSLRSGHGRTELWSRAAGSGGAVEPAAALHFPWSGPASAQFGWSHRMSSDASGVRLSMWCRLDSHPTFAELFDADGQLQVIVMLQERTLRVATSLIAERGSVPLAFGWSSGLTLPARTAPWTIDIPSKSRMRPSGSVRRLRSDQQARLRNAPLGSTRLDDAYVPARDPFKLASGDLSVALAATGYDVVHLGRDDRTDAITFAPKVVRDGTFGTSDEGARLHARALYRAAWSLTVHDLA